MKSRIHHTNSINILTLIAKVLGPLKRIPFLPILLDEQLKLYTFFFHPRRFMKMQELCKMISTNLHLETSFHRFGGIDFRYEQKEISHLHGNGLLDIYYPQTLAKALIAKGVTGVHHVYPGSGWTSHQILATTNVHVCFQLIEWSLLLRKQELGVESILEKIEKIPHHEK